MANYQISQVSRQPRTYESIWKQLRKTGKVTLEISHIELMPRIKSMVIKEKYMDEGFKIINDLERYRLKFDWNEKEKELKIELVTRLGLVDLVS